MALPSLIAFFLYEVIWPGLGLLSESYVLFSIGTLPPLWQYVTSYSIQRITYSSIAGIILGMIGWGYAGQVVGRRWGSIGTAMCMCGGATGLVLISWMPNDADNYTNLLASSMALWFFIFGVGVGGEYPMSASSASERTMTATRTEKGTPAHDPSKLLEENNNSSKSAGSTIQLVFSMQGVGIFLHCLVLLILMLVNPSCGSLPVNEQEDVEDEATISSLAWIWRIIYLLGWLLLVVVLLSRIVFLKESSAWMDDREQRKIAKSDSGNIVPSTPVSTPRKQAYATTPTSQNTGSYAISMLHYPNIRATPTRHRQFPPDVTASPSNLSMVSTVSSLSAPSLAIRHIEDHSSDSDDHKEWQHWHQIPDEDPGAVSQSTTVYSVLWRHYGARLVGSSACWMLWDVSFYGNKLFQSTFLLALFGNGEMVTITQLAAAAALNAAVALLGYWTAAYLLQYYTGRRQLQQWGLLVTGLLFVLCGLLYEHLSSRTLLFLYLASSFCGQVGPNATTFVLPAEIFPTQVRSFCHGVAAAAGKVGALLAAVAFQGIIRADEEDDAEEETHSRTSVQLFLISGYASFIASAITFWTIPETQGLDLHELDRKWHLTLQGRRHEYDGPANHPKYLSYYERSQLSARYAAYAHQDPHQEDEAFYALE